MATYGLTSTGFVLKRLRDILDDAEATLATTWGPAVDLDRSTPEGIIVGTFAAMLADGWEKLQALYDALNPENAEGVPLESLASIKGFLKQAATRSTVTLELRGTVGTVIDAGKQVSVGTGGELFSTDSAVTIAADGLGVGDDGVTVVATADEPGSIVGGVGAVDTIVTPVTGWSSVTNPAAIVPGDDTETDPQLRLRMQFGQPLGSAALEAIRSDVLQIENVLAALVVENTADTTVDGRPPHTIEVIIWPNTIAGSAIGPVLLTSAAFGIETTGDESVTVSDSLGNAHTIKWSYATQVDVDATITVTGGPEYPANGDAQVQAVVEAYLNAFNQPGADVRHHKIVSEIDQLGLDIDDLEVTLRRDADSFAEANVSIGETEVVTSGTVSVS